MRFSKHLFISYAHADNKATPDDPQGWITRFHEYLGCYLSTNIGEEARTWRDEKLHGNDIFPNEIVKQFPDTATFVSVISPRYLESDWCIKEISEFCRAAEQSGGLIVEDKARVLNVLLKPIPPDQRDTLPVVLKDALGYEFYQEAEGGRTLPLDPRFGSGEAYRRNIYFLAADAAELIKKLERGAPPAKAVQGRIYLAECSYDQAEDRAKIRGDLRAHGYAILPDQLHQFSDLETEYVQEVDDLLDQCQLSIHLVGCSRGKVPDGPSGKSVVQLQNELAAKRSRDRHLQRVIWLPDAAHCAQSEHKAFVDALQKDTELQWGADLITGDLESLKSAIQTALHKVENPKAQEISTAGSRSIYLICVERDLDAAAPLMDFLSGKGFSVELPIFSGSPTDVREANEAVTKNCCAAIIFFGAGDGAWKFHQKSELKRIRGTLREDPQVLNFTYLAAPETADKKVALLRREPNLINGIEGFSAEKMDGFLVAVSGEASRAQKAS